MFALSNRKSFEHKEQNTDDFYKLYVQFKDLNINVISSDNWVEMLKMIDDPIIRSQIIDKIGYTNTCTNDTRMSKGNPTQDNTYTIEELRRQLKNRSQWNHIPTTIQD